MQLQLGVQLVHGLLVTNDVSARDVQLTKAQFYESKSYPTFTPIGPALVLVDADELKRFGDLRLQLRVNGKVRQNMVVEGDMLYTPVQALQTLAALEPYLLQLRLEMGASNA